MKFVFALVCMSLFMISFVGAANIYGSADVNVGNSAEVNSNNEMQASTYSDSSTDSGISIGNDVSIDSNLRLTTSGGSNKIILSDGNEAIVQISSSQARSYARSEMDVNDCSNCSVRLVEVRENGDARAAYRVESTKPVRVFGIFRSNMNVYADVDAQTGTVISVHKPWWTFLSTNAEAKANSSTSAGY